MMEGMNSSRIYCKNFCKCHNVSPPGTTTKVNKKESIKNILQKPEFKMCEYPFHLKLTALYFRRCLILLHPGVEKAGRDHLGSHLMIYPTT
jgi:hypothetical protein